MFSKHSNTADRLDQRCKNCMKKVREEATGENARELDLDEPDLTCKDWQGGKYPGTIFKRTGKDTYTAAVSGKQKTFNPKNYASDDEAFGAANDWRKTTSDSLGITKNKYKIVRIDNKIYIIVQLSHGYVTLLDYEMLDFVRNHTLCAGKSSRENGKYYCLYFNREDGGMKGIHGYIIHEGIPDHIDRYPMDNRSINLRPTDYSANNKNRTCVHTASWKKVENGYEGTIEYTKTHKFQRQTVSQTLDSLDAISKWLKDKCRELDAANLKEETIVLGEQFEEIMKQHAPEYKWKEEQENLDKGLHLEAKKKESAVALFHGNKKLEIYKKYLGINPNFSQIEALVKPGQTIEHIKDQGKEYKYCSSCDAWITIEQFTKLAENWDNLNKCCKTCAAGKRRMKGKKEVQP